MSQGEQSDTSSESMYHINRSVLYYLSPFGLSKFGVIDNPDKVVKKRMPDTICYLLKTLQKAWQYKIFCRF